MLAEAAASAPFMSLAELKPRTEAGTGEVRVNEGLPDPTCRILVCCEFGRVSTLATATLREMGYQRTAALDGGMKVWREAGYRAKSGADPQLA